MATPSEKSPAVEAELVRIFGVSRIDAITADTCVPAPIGCGQSATEFKDEISRKEFTISGLCQECQDSIFG